MIALSSGVLELLLRLVEGAPANAHALVGRDGWQSWLLPVMRRDPEGASDAAAAARGEERALAMRLMRALHAHAVLRVDVAGDRLVEVVNGVDEKIIYFEDVVCYAVDDDDGLGTTWDRDGDDADEACPKCEGSGRTACSCTRWSGDGEGCGSCGYTGVTACPACRGGGRAVRVTVKIEAPSETSEGGFERDRSNATGSRATTTTTTTRARALRCVAVEGGTDYSVSTTPAIVDSTESKGPSGGRDEDGPSSSKDDDFYAQSGEAIRVLREDYPYLLTKEPRWTIYRDDIGLLDETMTFAGPGREGRNGVMATNMSEYKRVFKIIRIIAAVLFSQSTMEVSRIWSPLGSSGLRTIRVRWSVRGKVRLVGSIGADEARFDGISEYKLDSKGFIYEHKITDLDWDVAQLRERAVQMMRAAQGVQQPIGSGDW